MSHREEASGKTQDTLERLCLSAGLGTPRGPPWKSWRKCLGYIHTHTFICMQTYSAACLLAIHPQRPPPDPHPRPLHPQVLGSLSLDMCEQPDVVTSPQTLNRPNISPLRFSRGNVLDGGEDREEVTLAFRTPGRRSVSLRLLYTRTASPTTLTPACFLLQSYFDKVTVLLNQFRKIPVEDRGGSAACHPPSRKIQISLGALWRTALSPRCIPGRCDASLRSRRSYERH
ncbi:hypothetical protein L3Q82_019027 [Scortum barcoo]|uniref:Uncharacterized protein n=1 Tax=Scortum barcoo TaxID=214431 RepID=A0ACB8VG24_9TELE|nr:hypothetical protein L3Q82_019027 [Scortum barcoo]